MKTPQAPKRKKAVSMKAQLEIMSLMNEIQDWKENEKAWKEAKRLNRKRKAYSIV